MRIPRLLLLSLLMSVCVAPIVAQSSSDKISPDKSVASSQLKLDGPTNDLSAPPEFRTHVPAVSRKPLEGLSNLSSPRNYFEHFDQFKMLRVNFGSAATARYKEDTQELPESTSTDAYRLEAEALDEMAKRDLQGALKLGQSDTSCFSMRTYRVTRDDPQSDATRLSGYSTCQIAGQYQTKDAVILLETVPR